MRSYKPKEEKEDDGKAVHPASLHNRRSRRYKDKTPDQRPRHRELHREAKTEERNDCFGWIQRYRILSVHVCARRQRSKGTSKPSRLPAAVTTHPACGDNLVCVYLYFFFSKQQERRDLHRNVQPCKGTNTCTSLRSLSLHIRTDTGRQVD